MSNPPAFDTSPFELWIGTNYSPTDRELAQLKAFLDKPYRQLASLDADLLSLLQKRDELNSTIHAHEAFLNPFRRIPNEVFLEIFKLSMPRNHNATMSLGQAPLVLIQVCRSWRDIAMSLPQLWSSLHIPFLDGSPEFARFHAARVTGWLARAKGRTLALSLWSDPSYNSPESTKILVEALAVYAPSVKSITMETSATVLDVLSTTIPPTTFTLLEAIILKRVGSVHDASRRRPGLIKIHDLDIWKAPKLNTIEWISVGANLHSLPVQWDQIKEISISNRALGQVPDITIWYDPSGAQVRSILQATPNMTSLSVSLSRKDTRLRDLGPGRPGSIHNGPLVLPNLTHLNLHDAYLRPSADPISLLDKLQLPALTSLSYKLEASDCPEIEDGGSILDAMPTSDAYPLLRFLRSQQQEVLIDTWVADGHTIPHSAFVACLRLMPNLERLRIESRHLWGTLPVILDDDLLKAFLPRSNRWGAPPSVDAALSPDDEALCPKLHTFHVDKSYFSLNGMERFVYERCRLAHDAREGTSTKFAYLRRILVPFQCVRPDFVARDSRGGRCRLEERLNAMGIENVIGLYRPKAAPPQDQREGRRAVAVPTVREARLDPGLGTACTYRDEPDDPWRVPPKCLLY